MFSGFWGWFLVVVIVAVIFGAGRLPELKNIAEEKLKQGLDAVQKGKQELEAKINEAKQKRAEENQAGNEANVPSAKENNENDGNSPQA